MLQQFKTFITEFDQQLAKETNGVVAQKTSDFTPVASLRILTDLQQQRGLENLPSPEPHETLHERLAFWLRHASPGQKELAGLAVPIPPTGVHFVPGQFRIFYDFKNTDIVLDELQKAGVAIQGRFLDFGCSSGRNLAVLRRAYKNELELFGSDPARPSIEWLNRNLVGVQAIVNAQMPPIPFSDASFDIIVAKSIWTHFSPEAARSWFAEMLRIMAPGAHFLFSTHGPHDIASRIIYDNPRPHYERFAGHENWTRDEFLLDLIENLKSAKHYFQPYKTVDHQGDLKLVDNATTGHWGLLFMTEEYVRSILPKGLTIISRSIGRTGNRHDVYVVRRH